ncbi:unnamed protein product [Toxocara canis]|uniref:Metallophos domain-containing protein n=1 Tax=Toxocara canis TaxID=6265 RepID=A0A183U500_TOXCA|nr:unnamed protein product [Toxocara canis]
MFDKTTKCSSGGIALSRIERSLLTIVNCVQLNQSIAKHFSENQLVPILHRGEVRFLKEPMLLEFPLTEYGIVVVGDLHGSIFDLLAVLHSIGLPPDVHYLFLGKIVYFAFDQTRKSTLSCLLLPLLPLFPSNLGVEPVSGCSISSRSPVDLK